MGFFLQLCCRKLHENERDPLGFANVKYSFVMYELTVLVISHVDICVADETDANRIYFRSAGFDFCFVS